MLSVFKRCKISVISKKYEMTQHSPTLAAIIIGRSVSIGQIYLILEIFIFLNSNHIDGHDIGFYSIVKVASKASILNLKCKLIIEI